MESSRPIVTSKTAIICKIIYKSNICGTEQKQVHGIININYCFCCRDWNNIAEKYKTLQPGNWLSDIICLL